MTRPLIRPYARIERERRFVLDALPPEVDPTDFRRLRDRFLEGTGLRLRRVERPDGSEIITKLGQKLPDPEAPEDRRRARLTTIYLQVGQAEPLEHLPAASNCKRRYTLSLGGRTWAIDAWEKPASIGPLILAEVEAETDAELDAISPPRWCAREVSQDARYSAYALATSSSRPG